MAAAGKLGIISNVENAHKLKTLKTDYFLAMQNSSHIFTFLLCFTDLNLKDIAFLLQLKFIVVRIYSSLYFGMKSIMFPPLFLPSFASRPASSFNQNLFHCFRGKWKGL